MEQPSYLSKPRKANFFRWIWACAVMTETRVIKVVRRTDGRFITQSAIGGESPMGVDTTLNQAVGTAVREATAMSRDLRCRVAIQVEQPNGSFKLEQVVNPPVTINYKPRPNKLALKP
jgi:hypothetical protein